MIDYPPNSDNGSASVNVLSKIAAISFFLLFPGFLIYHQLLAMELLQPFIRGLFGPVSLASLLAFLVLLPWNRDWLRACLKERYVLYVLIFLFYTLVWTVAHYLIQAGENRRLATPQSLQTIVFWACLFLTGLLLPLESKALKRMFFVVFLLTLLFLLHFSISAGQLTFRANWFYGQWGDDVATHQGYSRSVLVILLFLLAVCAGIKVRIGLILSGAFVLFMLASRADFSAFLVVCLALSVIFGIKKPAYFLVAPIFFLVLSGMFLVATNVDDRMTMLHLTRQLEIFDLHEATSWINRMKLQEIALEQIAAHPLTGQFGGHVTAAGHTGKYAHNALSAWVSYGFFGFFIYLGLIVVAFGVSAHRFILKGQDAPVWVFAFLLNLLCLLLVMAARSVYWPLPALGWGLVVQGLINSRSGVRAKPL